MGANIGSNKETTEDLEMNLSARSPLSSCQSLESQSNKASVYQFSNPTDSALTISISTLTLNYVKCSKALLLDTTTATSNGLL